VLEFLLTMRGNPNGDHLSMDPDFFAEFDRYVERNCISPEDMPFAMERFMLEYGEMPDARLEGRIAPDDQIEPVESHSEADDQ
jgi:hypothetical protein